MIEIDLKRSQVSIVDAHQRGFELQDTVQILGIVDFDERLHAEFARVEIKVSQVAVVEALGDQQNAVGSGGASLGHLIAVDEEVFPQHRDLHHLPHGEQIVEMPLKEMFVGQHTQACGPVLLVGEGDLYRIEVGTNDASRGRGFLHFSDQRQIGLRPQSRHEIAHGWRVGQPVLNRLHRTKPLRLGDLTPFVVDDPSKNIVGGKR